MLQETTTSSTSAMLVRVILVSLWLISIVSMALSWLPDIDRTRGLAGLTSLLFILMLIVFLIRTTPHATDLPDLTALIAPRLGFWAMFFSIMSVILLVLCIGLIVSPGVSLLTFACLIALGIMITWRGKVRWLVVLAGLGAGLIVAFGIRYLEQGQLAWAIMNGMTIPPVFIAGVLLLTWSGLGQVRLLAGQYRLSLRGFVWGGVLAIPPAILNSMGNIQSGDTWVIHWWQPLAALDPAISEEIWARLLLTTLVYILLRPLSNSRPRRALGVAVLVSSLTHSFAHSGINPLGLLIGGLLYDIPLGLLFVKRDLEHVIGYHFGIDFLRFLAALSANA